MLIILSSSVLAVNLTYSHSITTSAQWYDTSNFVNGEAFTVYDYNGTKTGVKINESWDVQENTTLTGVVVTSPQLYSDSLFYYTSGGGNIVTFWELSTSTWGVRTSCNTAWAPTTTTGYWFSEEGLVYVLEGASAQIRIWDIDTCSQIDTISDFDYPTHRFVGTLEKLPNNNFIACSNSNKLCTEFDVLYTQYMDDNDSLTNIGGSGRLISDDSFFVRTSTTNVDVYNITYYESPYNLIDGVNYSKSYCVDDETFCTSTSYGVDVNGEIIFYCDDVNNSNYCSDSCDNNLIDGVLTGSCTQLGCVAECNNIGDTTCTSGTTYAICGQFDVDACLEYGTPLYCPSSQYCSNEDIGSQCSNITSGDFYTQNFLWVDLELTSQTGVIKEEGTSKLTKNVISGAISLIVPISSLFPSLKTYVLESFTKEQINETYVQSSFNENSVSQNFISNNCDYEEEFFITDDLEHNDLTGNGWSGNGTINTTGYNFISSSSQMNKSITDQTNTKISTIIELEETGTYNILFYKDGNTILDLQFVNNKTNYNLALTEEENSLNIFNSTSTSDDLQEIIISTSFINDVEAVNVEVTLIREVLGVDIQEKYFSLPIITGDHSPDKIVYNNNGNEIKIYEVIASSVKDYLPYSNNENSIKSFTCEHEQSECFIIRSYANTQGMSTYYFYEDIQTCIASLDGVISPTTPTVISDERSLIERILNVNWNTKDALFYSVLTLILVFGIFAGLSYYEKDGTFVVIGTLLTGILMFYFILEGFIPVWVIILFGIIGSLLGASVIRNMVTGGGN